MGAYASFAMLSCLSRADFNVPISLVGTFNESDANMYGRLLLVSAVLDVAWLCLGGENPSHYDQVGLGPFKGVAIFALVVSVLNLLIKFPLFVCIKFHKDEKSINNDEAEAQSRLGPVNSDH